MAKSTKSPVRAIALGRGALTTVKEIQQIPVVEGFSITVNGLVITGTPAFDRWAELGSMLRTAERGIQFAIGDFLNEIEGALGEAASQIVDYSEGWRESTCEQYRWIAKHIPQAIRRMDRLGIAHHALVAPLPRRSQEKWLTMAAADEDPEPWTVKRLKEAIEEGEDLPPLAWWVLVSATDPNDQRALMESLVATGRSVKATTRRDRRRKATA